MEKILTKNVGKENSQSIEVYESGGGYRQLRKSGELRTREFHEAIEQTHIGYIHKYVRKWGWLKYDYMRQTD